MADFEIGNDYSPAGPFLIDGEDYARQGVVFRCHQGGELFQVIQHEVWFVFVGKIEPATSAKW